MAVELKAAAGENLKLLLKAQRTRGCFLNGGGKSSEYQADPVSHGNSLPQPNQNRHWLD
jgi:hypothetical protein